MPLTLSDQDLAELNNFAMEQFRGKEIAALQEWLRRKQIIQMAAAEKAKADADAIAEKAAQSIANDAVAAKAANGHDANPYAPPA